MADTGYSRAAPTDFDTIPWPADGKPVKDKGVYVTQARTFDLSDVPAKSGVNYFVIIEAGQALTVPGLASPVTNTGAGPITAHFESTGTAGQVRRIGGEAGGATSYGPRSTVAAFAGELATANDGDLFHLGAADGARPKGIYKAVGGSLPATPWVDLTGVADTPSVSALLSDGPFHNLFADSYLDQAATNLTITNGNISGQAVTIEGAAGKVASLLYNDTTGGPFNNHLLEFAIDVSQWIDGSNLRIWLNSDSGSDFVSIDKTGADVSASDPDLASQVSNENVKVDLVSAQVVGNVMTIKVRTRHWSAGVDNVLRIGAPYQTSGQAHKFVYIAAKSESPAVSQVDEVVGIWKGEHALTSGHLLYDFHFDMTKCDYIDFTLHDDGTDQWSWHGRVEMRSFSLRPRIMLHRHAGSHVWVRNSAGANLSIGRLSIADQGGAGQRIGQAVGYKRPTL